MNAPPVPRGLKLLLGPALGALAYGMGCLGGLQTAAALTAGITTWTATWWISEALPIPAASLVPFALLPLAGVLDHEQAARAYGHPIVLLLIGGFMLSRAVEASGAHRRMALGFVRALGRFGPAGIVGGFMLGTALCSMWISNTATVLVLLPVAMATAGAGSNEGIEDANAPARRDLARALFLGIAYAASIGGLGTPIGTTANLQFLAVYEGLGGAPIGFLEWMSYGLPVVVLALPAAWWILTRKLGDGPIPELPALGPWRPAEKRVLTIFALTALAWITRTAPAGGWAAWSGLEGGVGDETVALAAVLLLFCWPDGEGSRLLRWEAAERIPWGLLLLFGGGLALAGAFQSSGLSNALAAGMTDAIGRHPFWIVVLAIALSVTFATEFTSNTATTALLMPILAAAAIAAGLAPPLLMLPAAMSASCAFMMPVATTPNAIVFGTGRVELQAMLRHGLALNLVCALIITLVCVWRLG